PFRRKGIDFKLTVVCGSHSSDSLTVKMGQDRNGKSGSLGGICSCSQLVKKNQRIPVCLFQEPDNIRHMGGKGTQGLFNTLLVSDLGVCVPERAEPGMIEGRKVES